GRQPTLNARCERSAVTESCDSTWQDR
ncbi:hypothetical protein V3C99_006779, partial [Haemonchus contortus]|uniref:DUF4124 domain-containing protein n=1 Tax=Haemonchus contortus TaxID=6289 RepID=A0A6F7PSN6_HAECO